MADSIEQYHAQSETGAVVNVLYQQVGKDPVAWQRQVDGEQTVIAEEMKGDLTELGVMCVSILRADGSEIISESTGKPCPSLPPGALVDLPAGGPPILLEDVVEPSTWTSIATVRLPGLSRLAIVTATRRSLPSEGSISRLTKPNIVMFGFIIGASLLLALWLVIRAQRSLDTTFMALSETKARMQRFISRGARANARDGSAGPTKHDAVVLMADLRNFELPPEIRTLT